MPTRRGSASRVFGVVRRAVGLRGKRPGDQCGRHGSRRSPGVATFLATKSTANLLPGGGNGRALGSHALKNVTAPVEVAEIQPAAVSSP